MVVAGMREGPMIPVWVRGPAIKKCSLAEMEVLKKGTMVRVNGLLGGSYSVWKSSDLCEVRGLWQSIHSILCTDRIKGVSSSEVFRISPSEKYMLVSN